MLSICLFVYIGVHIHFQGFQCFVLVFVKSVFDVTNICALIFCPTNVKSSPFVQRFITNFLTFNFIKLFCIKSVQRSTQIRNISLSLNNYLKGTVQRYFRPLDVSIVRTMPGPLRIRSNIFGFCKISLSYSNFRIEKSDSVG